VSEDIFLLNLNTSWKGSQSKGNNDNEKRKSAQSVFQGKEKLTFDAKFGYFLSCLYQMHTFDLLSKVNE